MSDYRLLGASSFKKDEKSEKAMKKPFIPLDLATFETMPKFLPGDITIYNVGSFRDVSNKTDVKKHVTFFKHFRTLDNGL